VVRGATRFKLFYFEVSDGLDDFGNDQIARRDHSCAIGRPQQGLFSAGRAADLAVSDLKVGVLPLLLWRLLDVF